MYKSIRGKALLVGAWVFATASAQLAQAQTSLDAALVYQAADANVVHGNRFWLQGGSVQVHAQFWRGLGAVADVSVIRSGHLERSGPGLDLVTAAFGPRYTWSPPGPYEGRYALFGQFLVGDASGMNGIFPTATGAIHSSANSFGMYLGGGVNVPLRNRLTLRAFEADWLHTQMPNAASGVQNSLRLGAGLIFKFK
jgi:hypothetical protein